MTTNTEDKGTDPVLTFLAVIGWILPLAGFVWGPGQWWAYAIWLLIGTVLILSYANKHE